MTVETTNTDEHHDDAFGHESNVISGRVVAIAFIGVIVLMVVATAMAVIWLNIVDEQRAKIEEPTAPLVQDRQLQSEPELNASKRQQRMALRAEWEELLNRYETLDAENEIYRIPIDRAMKTLADEGLPTPEEQENQ